MKTTIKINLFAASLLLTACKAPMATVVQDQVKNNLPAGYTQDQEKPADSTQNSGLVPWKEFFNEPHLSSLIETALKNNQELMITLQQIEIAKSDALYKSGRLKPAVTAGIGAGLDKAGRYTSEGAGDATTEIKPGKEMPDPLGDFSAGFSADWEADIWHKLRTEKQSAVAHYLATVEGKNFVLSSLISEIAENYYDLLALDNQLDVIRQYIQLQQKAVEMSKIQKQAAAATELAVKKFQAELAGSKATEYTLLQEITEKENTLNALLGRYPQPIERDKTSFLSIVPKTVYTGIPSQLLANRPDIKQAELELQSAKLDVEAARKAFYPSVDISATLGLNAFNPTYLTRIPESLAYSIAGDLAGPLINKTAIQAEFKAADARQIQALYEYDKSILNGYLEVSNLMSKIHNADGYYQLKSEESKELDESIGIAEQLFRNSRADYLEVLTNQRDALEARMELIEAKVQQLNTVVAIYKSLGGGWK